MMPPRLPPLLWTAAARARLNEAIDRREGGFVLEGRKAVADALARPDLRAFEVWMADDLPPELVEDFSAAAAERGVRVGRAPTRDLDRMSDVVTPQGILAVVADPARSIAEVLAVSGPLVLLDGVQDPGNVGAVLRCAAGLRFVGALVGGGSADPVGRKALRASAGAAIAIPFARGEAATLVDAVRAAGRPLWWLDGEGDDVFSLEAAPHDLVLAVGSEGRGPGAAVRAGATCRVGVPIAPVVESLNAAVAFGIVAAHVVRLGARAAGGIQSKASR